MEHIFTYGRINLFDIKSQDCDEHFIRIALLNFLSKISMESSTRGYFKKSELLNYLTSLGYNYFLIEETIEYLLENNCVRGRVENILDVSHIEKIRMTTLGRYHLFSLVSVFQYFDAIIIDTPILDKEIREQMNLNADIKSRISRTELFLEYLNNCSESIDNEIKQVWQRIYKEVCANIKEINERISC